ncbi:hypothetical protein [Streptomyces prunicolor]|uniref:hypothetical protein n=1 Tax=Streptomyces prunicolor TaxID=67348 RepID=UPI001319C3A5|nr:hypothetical protein [Streptomyces prunicolor]
MAAATDSLFSGELCTLVACSPYGTVSDGRGLSEPPMGDDVAVSLDLSSYELLWPALLFAADGECILRVTGRAWEEQAKWLLTEALGGRPGLHPGARGLQVAGLGTLTRFYPK